jgi:hypothetical protein
MKRETVDIVEDLIAALKIVVPFNTIVDNLDGTYTIESCNTGYLCPCYKFVLDGIDYTVLNEVGKEFVFNSKFTIKGNVIPTATQVLLDGLKYYHGTVIATKEELRRKELASDKFPMAFLLEVLEDNFNNSDDARIDRVSKLRLFFLSSTDENNWTTQEHYEFSIKPMKNLLDKFITYLDKSNLIGKVDSYKAVNHPKFGVFVAAKGGTVKRIFNEELSGVELSIDLPIRKSKDCDDCNTEVILDCLPATITDSDGVSTFEVLSGGTGACTTITPPIVKSGISYNRPSLIGDSVSYRTGDNYWNVVNNPYPSPPANPTHHAELLDFLTLKKDNSFGNRLRFTDLFGTEIFATNYVIDHYTGLGYYNSIQSPALNWDGSIDLAYNSNSNGYSDWKMANTNETDSICIFGINPVMNYTAFNGFDRYNFRLATGFCSNTRASNTSQCYYLTVSNGVRSVIAKTSSLYFVMVRNHF